MLSVRSFWIPLVALGVVVPWHWESQQRDQIHSIGMKLTDSRRQVSDGLAQG